MNEPSVFNGPEVTMHKDAKHGEWEHRDVHNVYGLNVHVATVEGLVARNPNKNVRPFVLSRAFFAGTQRIGAIWTGDNNANWDHLAASSPMLLSIGVAGLTFSGADVGGFFGNPDVELLTRWYQAGAFQPFFRAHAHHDSKRREPFLFDEPHRSVMRDAILQRYALLPYWYTLFHNSSLTGFPTMRPMWAEFPQDPNTFPLQDQFMVGPAILVKPVTKPGTSSLEVYLPPSDVFYDYSSFAKSKSGKVFVNTPLDKIPAFYRGGHVVVRKERVRRSSTQMKGDPFTLVIALDSNNQARGEIYVDDYVSFDYKNGVFLHREILFKDNQLTSRLISGNYKPSELVERLIVLGLPKQPSKITFDGRTLESEWHNGVLTVRKPLLKIAEDFTIKF